MCCQHMSHTKRSISLLPSSRCAANTWVMPHAAEVSMFHIWTKHVEHTNESCSHLCGAGNTSLCRPKPAVLRQFPNESFLHVSGFVSYPHFVCVSPRISFCYKWSKSSCEETQDSVLDARLNLNSIPSVGSALLVLLHTLLHSTHTHVHMHTLRYTQIYARAHT